MRIELSDEDVDLRPRRPVDECRTVERGVKGPGERDCRLYDVDDGIRWLVWYTDEPAPGVDGFNKAVPSMPRPEAPFAAWPLT